MICEIAGLTVVQLSPLFFLIPFVILMLTDKSAIVKNITLTLWTGSISLVVQYVCAHFLGAETPAILGSIAAIVAIIAYAKLFIRKKVAVATPDGGTVEVEVGGNAEGNGYTLGETFKAWSVYIFILVFILASGALCPPINSFLKSLKSFIIYCIALNDIILQNLIGPASELNASPGFDAVAYGNDHIQIIIFNISFDISSAFILNCRKICDS